MITLFDDIAPPNLFWDLVSELFANPYVLVESETTRRIIGAGVRQPEIQLQDFVQEIGGQQKPWTPTVGILAGILAAKFPELGLPDVALLSLYRDGDDWIDWHCDPEYTVGPQPGDTRVAIFSFGAPRYFLTKPITGTPWGDGEGVASLNTYEPAPGSLLMFTGDVQRKYVHAVPKTPALPRLSVSFTWRCRYDAKEAAIDGRLPWMLVQPEWKRGGLVAPFFVGSREDAILHYARCEQPVEIVAANGHEANFEYVLSQIVDDWGDEGREIKMLLRRSAQARVPEEAQYDYEAMQNAVEKLTAYVLTQVPELTPAAVKAVLG